MGKIVSTDVVRQPYQSPRIVELGSLHDLTLEVKVGPNCDISCYHNTSASE